MGKCCRQTESSDYVAAMEDALELEPYDPCRAVVGFDESPVQLRSLKYVNPWEARPGRIQRYDVEYTQWRPRFAPDVAANIANRNKRAERIQWKFATKDARGKLTRLNPSITS